MDERATELLAALRTSSLSVDAKIASLAKLKSEIKQRNVPTAAAGDIFDAVRLAIASQHASLSAGGFSALGHLLKRLYLQEQDALIASQGRSTYTLLLEKLGDHKERVRAQASQAFTDFWPASPAEVEHHVLEVALVGKSPRAKETSMMWLVKMTKEHGVLFRAHVRSLVVGLEDADSGVRETAKAAVIELFQNAPSRAISDLKKQIQSHNVRRSITLSIFAALGINSIPDADLPSSHSGPGLARPGSSFSNRREDVPRPNSVLSTRSHSNQDGQARNDESNLGPSRPLKGDPPRRDALLSHAASVESLPAISLEPEEPEPIDPITIYSNREIDDMFRDIAPHFEGKETEHNWLLREKGVTALRRLTKGNAPHEYQVHYLAGIKQLLDGILKAVNSLRTTLSAAGCSLIQDIARVNGTAIDPMVEILLQSFIKLCGAVKKITSQNGNITVDTIIGNISYSVRVLQHLWAACQDKNTQPRLFATGWLKTLMTRHSRQKNAIEHSGGVDLIEKCIKRGLADANPGVRESMRGTYWAFSLIWPDRARGIISELDVKSRSLLEKDPSNPNAAAHSTTTATSRGGQPQASSSTRMTLKETIAAQKKARIAAARNLPPRPESAQSTFSEPRPARPTAQRQPVSTSAIRNTTTSSHLSSSVPSAQGGSLSSAPMRPAMRPRRPELMRPATADPYSRRNVPLSAQAKGLSPSNSPQRPTPKSAPVPRARNPPARPKSRMENVTTSTNSVQRKPAASEPPVLQRAEPKTISLIDPETQLQLEPQTMISTPHAVGNAVSNPDRVEEDLTITLPNFNASAQSEEIRDPVFAPKPTFVDPVENLTEHPAVAETEVIGSVMEAHETHVTIDPPADGPTAIDSINSLPVDLNLTEPHTKSITDVLDSPKGLMISENQITPFPQNPVSTTPLSKPPLTSSIEIFQTSDGHLPSSPLATPSKSVNQTAVPQSLTMFELSPPPTSTDSTALKVYEDPQSPLTKAAPPPPTTPQASRLVPKAKPQEALPLNESSSTNRKYNQDTQSIAPLSYSPPAPASNENSHRRWKKVELSERRRSLSPNSRDPSRARDMIDRGLAKIKISSLDVHGYRKFQGLIRHHESIMNDDAKYSPILLALFDALESPDGDKVSGRSFDIKTQVLFTIRLMFSQNQELFSKYYSRAMVSIIKARKHYEITNHIVSGLEETSEDIASACNPSEVANAILELLEIEDTSPESSRMVSMGTYVLCGLLHRLNEKKLYLSDPELERLGKFARENLRNPQPDVRRAVMEFCLELHEMVKPEEKFWSIVNSPGEDVKPLLTYYIMRKPKASN